MMLIRVCICALFAACCQLAVVAQSFTPGESYFGAHGYIEYLPGTLPLIISAPHGGYLNPEIIPDRTCGDAVYTNDAYTQELARDIYQAVFDRFGCYPHLVINKLDRAKLDANRNLFEGACGNDSAVQAWNDFNDLLDTAEAAVMEKYGKGFYIDLHGHGHAIQRLELGYLLFTEELQLSDAELNVDPYLGYSSIQHLVATNPLALTHAALLRGPEALGSLFELAGYPSVPAMGDPYPATADPYFSGGYNTAERSSYSGGTIDGVQIECNMNGVRNSADNRVRFADSLAAVLYEYLTLHYFPNNELAACGAATSAINASATQLPVCTVHTEGNTWYIQTNAASIAIFDITGRQLFFSSSDPGTLTVDAATWPSGMYLLTAISAQHSIATLRIFR